MLVLLLLRERYTIRSQTVARERPGLMGRRRGLGLNVDELLLQDVLLVGQVDVPRQKIGQDVRVHLLLARAAPDVDGRRRQNLLRQGVHLATGVQRGQGDRVEHLGREGRDGGRARIGHDVLAPAEPGGTAAQAFVVAEPCRRGRRWSGRRPRGRAKAGQEMRPVGLRPRVCHVDRRRLGQALRLGFVHRQMLDVGAFPPRSETGSGHAEGAGRVKIRESHLSKTASVHTQ